MQTAAVKELAKDLIEVASKAKAEAKVQQVKATTEKAVKSISLKSAAKITMKEMEIA